VIFNIGGVRDLGKQNKNALIIEISDETGFSRKDVSIIINLFIKKIMKAMLDGEKVLLKGFATFMIRLAKPRRANDFQNEGCRIKVGARNLPKVKFSDSFVKKIKRK
jgi:DNA-binding protein HU-beta